MAEKVAHYAAKTKEDDEAIATLKKAYEDWSAEDYEGLYDAELERLEGILTACEGDAC